MNLIRLSDRIARLEAQRRSSTPDRQRLAEASARLIAAVNATHDPRGHPGLHGGDRGGTPERRPVTIIDFTRRLARLEARRAPLVADPRIAEEARERAVRGILGLLAAYEAGEEPTSLIGRALVEHDFDIVAACTALIERRGMHQ